MIFVSWILYRMLTLDENMKESMRSYYKASDKKQQSCQEINNN